MTYMTIQGDTWDGVAFKVYGKESLMPLLINANPGQADTIIFSGGIHLETPTPPIEYTTSLPPWKRGESI